MDKRELIEELSPFSDEIKIIIELPNGVLTSAKGWSYSWKYGKDAEAVFVIETSNK